VELILAGATGHDAASAVASEYARALLGLAAEAGMAEAVEEDLTALVGAFGSDEALAEFLASPAVAPSARQEALDRALGGRVSALALDFMSVLQRNGRGGLLPDVAAAYHRLLIARSGGVEVTVFSAVELDDELRGRLAAVLRDVLGADPVMQLTVDPEVLGGLRLRVGDRVIDASLAGALQRLREDLLHHDWPGPEGHD
jgi:F-type H+-transporting ATPase subunit delta